MVLADTLSGQRPIETSVSSPDVDVHEVYLLDQGGLDTVALADRLLRDGFVVTTACDGASCLEMIAVRIPAAILLDLSTTNGVGLDMMRSLRAWQCPSPVIVVTMRGDVKMAVEAMKCGALDALEKPLDPQALMVSLRDAIRCVASPRPPRPSPVRQLNNYGVLTRREMEVLTHVAAGASNKEAGRQLGISPRTVEVHRARIMEKLGARNTADLVRIVMSESGVRSAEREIDCRRPDAAARAQPERVLICPIGARVQRPEIAHLPQTRPGAHFA